MTTYLLVASIYAQEAKPIVLKDSEFVLTDAQAAAGIDGRIKISLDVDEKGIVKKAEIIAGPIYPCKNSPKAELEQFRSAAIANAMSFRFSPAMRNSKPIKSTIILTVLVGSAFKASLEKREVDPNRIKKDDYQNGDVVNGRALKLPRPSWPVGNGDVRSKVVVDVIIGLDGTVEAAGTISGWQPFYKAARGAACDAKFSPTLVSGRPIYVTGQIVYDFDPVR